MARPSTLLQLAVVLLLAAVLSPRSVRGEREVVTLPIATFRLELTIKNRLRQLSLLRGGGDEQIIENGNGRDDRRDDARPVRALADVLDGGPTIDDVLRPLAERHLAALELDDEGFERLAVIEPALDGVGVGLSQSHRGW